MTWYLSFPSLWPSSCSSVMTDDGQEARRLTEATPHSVSIDRRAARLSSVVVFVHRQPIRRCRTRLSFVVTALGQLGFRRRSTRTAAFICPRSRRRSNCDERHRMCLVRATARQAERRSIRGNRNHLILPVSDQSIGVRIVVLFIDSSTCSTIFDSRRAATGNISLRHLFERDSSVVGRPIASRELASFALFSPSIC
jgi:hypothetical protein